MENTEGQTPSQEVEESGSRFNLLTNYEETLQAMAEIQGVAWLESQMREAPADLNVKGALAQLKMVAANGISPELNDGILTTIYGAGGGLRWGVTFSGEVKFSGFHIASGSQGQDQLEKAKALGFKIY